MEHGKRFYHMFLDIEINNSHMRKRFISIRNFLYVTLLACLFSSGCNLSRNSGVSATEYFVDSLFQVNVDSDFIAGGSILLFKNGEKVIDKSYGFANMELSTPMPENPIFEIGSVTKQFTAAAILKLVEQNKLSLNDDFTKYLDFDTKGRIVTIGHLLNHTSGIAGYTEMPFFGKLMTQNYERDSLVRLVEQEEFLFEPGDALIYNNSAYFFLGLVIEKIAGVSYEEYLTQQFFEPLKMNDTYYCNNSTIRERKVSGYGYGQNGLQQKSYIDHTWPYSAGSLCSTTNDILIWMRAMHEGRLLSSAMYQLLVTPTKLNNGSVLRYAMGLINYQNYGTHEIGHGGAIPGFLSQTSYFPEEDLYIICLINTVGPKGAGILTNEIVWNLLGKQEPQEVNVDVKFSKLTGTYSGPIRGGNMSITVSEIPGGITTQSNRQDKPDTLKNYQGNGTWMNGNNSIRFFENELIFDNLYGHYILNKQ